MKQYLVQLEHDALAEIREAFDYIEARSPMNAERWLAGLWEAIDQLETMPTAYPYARERRVSGRELRQFVYKSHRVVFEVGSNVVTVVHLRHAARERFNRE